MPQSTRQSNKMDPPYNYLLFSRKLRLSSTGHFFLPFYDGGVDVAFRLFSIAQCVRRWFLVSSYGAIFSWNWNEMFLLGLDNHTLLLFSDRFWPTWCNQLFREKSNFGIFFCVKKDFFDNSITLFLCTCHIVQKP